MSTKNENIKKLFSMSNMANNLDEMIDIMVSVMPPDIATLIGPLIKEAATSEAAMSNIVDIYGDLFTEKEVQGILDFYEGEFGSKFIANQTELKTRVTAMYQELYAEVFKNFEKNLGLPGEDEQGQLTN